MSLLRKQRNGTFIINKREFSLRLRKILGFKPKNISIYEMAFIHRSATINLPDGSRINNERLEYLGDAIIDAVLSEFLFNKFPDADEGTLTKYRSRLVNREKLNEIALNLGIENLLISHINKSSPSRHLYGDALEALIGSIFIDRGFNRTRRFLISKLLSGILEQDELFSTDTDYKSQVFQWAQKLNRQISFSYKEESDEDYNNSLYKASLRIDHEFFGEGTGGSKKEAEQEASYEAWQKIGRIGFIE